MAEIVVHNIKKSYSKHVVLDELSFRCNNEIVFIAGKNGTGKTTFIKIALGLEVADAGNISFVDHDKKVEKEEMCAVFDSSTLYENMSGKANISILCTGYLKDSNDIWSILNGLNIDKVLLSKKVKHYSFGQKHRLSVAIALIRKPKILFLDEPTIGLDPSSWELVKKHIRITIKKQQGCVIVTGQDYFEMGEFADKILILDEGKAKVFCTIDDFLATFPQSIIITLKEEQLPKELNDICYYQKHNELNQYYFDLKDRERVLKILEANSLSIMGLTIEKISIKDAFLQTVDKKEGD